MLEVKLLILSLLVLTLSGCISRKQILAEVWLEGGISPEVCKLDARIPKFGVYRRLNDEVCEKLGKKVPCYEFLSYCAKEIQNSVRFNSEKFYQILDATLPE
jgi:hypothetical protein